VNDATEIDVRDVRPSDLPALVQLILAFRRERGEIDESEAEAASVLQAISQCRESPGHDLIVAERAGEAVGYLALHRIPFPMLAGSEGYVSDLLVRSSLRGSGIGKALLAEAERRARQSGCVRLMLNNRVAAESYARGFFVAVGFRERRSFASFVKPLDG
jgi:GNAT superfamily N-acetyltransferase